MYTICFLTTLCHFNTDADMEVDGFVADLIETTPVEDVSPTDSHNDLMDLVNAKPTKFFLQLLMRIITSDPLSRTTYSPKRR